MMPEPPRLPIVEGIADALPVPPEVSEAPGVAFAPPPLEVFPQVMEKIDAAVASLPAGKRGGLISVFEVTPEGVTRVNAAIVHKVGEHSTVSAWIGKEWGGARDGVSYGVAWITTW
jgi:hypothetical protein